MSDLATQVHQMTDTETRLVSVGFINKLESGELLTGTPTVAEESTTDLTITNKAVNTSTLTIDGTSHVAGQAVQFLVTGGTAGNMYHVDILCGTDSTPAQTLNGEVRLQVKGT